MTVYLVIFLPKTLNILCIYLLYIHLYVYVLVLAKS